MQVALTVPEHWALRALQKQRRDEDGYVKVTLMLMLDSGWPVGSVAEALGLDEATLYRYVRAFTDLGLEKYLRTSAPATGACSAVPNSAASARRLTPPAIPTSKLFRTGWRGPAGSGIRFPA